MKTWCWIPLSVVVLVAWTTNALAYEILSRRETVYQKKPIVEYELRCDSGKTWKLACHRDRDVCNLNAYELFNGLSQWSLARHCPGETEHQMPLASRSGICKGFLMFRARVNARRYLIFTSAFSFTRSAVYNKYPDDASCSRLIDGNTFAMDSEELIAKYYHIPGKKHPLDPRMMIYPVKVEYVNCTSDEDCNATLVRSVNINKQKWKESKESGNSEFVVDQYPDSRFENLLAEQSTVDIAGAGITNQLPILSIYPLRYDGRASTEADNPEAPAPAPGEGQDQIGNMLGKFNQTNRDRERTDNCMHTEEVDYTGRTGERYCGTAMVKGQPYPALYRCQANNTWMRVNIYLPGQQETCENAATLDKKEADEFRRNVFNNWGK